MKKILHFCIDRPKVVTWIMLVVTAGFLFVAVLPSIWPNTFSTLHPLTIDTDPENMLPEDEAVRIFHHSMKQEFSLHDVIVLGVVNDVHPEGVFNPESLRKIYELTEFAKTLRWPLKDHPDDSEGVIEVDIIAPSTVDNIEQGGPGVVKFEWLMPSPPATAEEALSIRHKAERIPFLKGTVLSEDGKAVALYIPVTSKDLSYKISSKLKEKIATFSGDELYFITGLPVAEDTFGLEMFKQMAVTAPLAMFVIFLLMFFFFRKLILIISPLIVAMVSVICTMGLLIATGNTIHIMSSMIPIFIMPIAVLDAVHILSEFFDRYQETRDRRKTMLKVMDTLSTPMLYTTLTTAVGFASLALTPIPPVQVFGLFVAFGVINAWFWTVTFIPAYIMLIKEESLEDFGMTHDDEAENKSTIKSLLPAVGRLTFYHAKPVMAVTVILTLIAVYGIFQININDNPIKWFKFSHPIRVADRVLNDHFGGTYMAYLALKSEKGDTTPGGYTGALLSRLEARVKEIKETTAIEEVFNSLRSEVLRISPEASLKQDLLGRLDTFANSQADTAPDDQFDAWDEVLLFLDQEHQQDQIFKQPKVLAYIEALQKELLKTGVVGKDYDMPVAVLSSLSLGLAIDYAIHFLVRSRMLQKEHGSWLKAVEPVFGEPARAISRNVVVVGAGFLPLLAASLIPYQTVGIFIAAILLTAGAASLLILPSLITLLERWLFPSCER